MEKGNTLQQVRDSELRNECINQEFKIKDLMRYLKGKDIVVESLIAEVKRLNNKIKSMMWSNEELETENNNLKEMLQINGFNEDLYEDINEYKKGDL